MKILIITFSLIISQTASASLGWFLFGVAIGESDSSSRRDYRYNERVVEKEKKIIIPSRANSCLISFIDKWEEKRTINTSYIVSVEQEVEKNCVKEKKYKKCAIQDLQGCLIYEENYTKECIEKRNTYYSRVFLINDTEYTIKTSLDEFNRAIAQNCRG